MEWIRMFKFKWNTTPTAPPIFYLAPFGRYQANNQQLVLSTFPFTPLKVLKQVYEWDEGVVVNLLIATLCLNVVHVQSCHSISEVVIEKWGLG